MGKINIDQYKAIFFDAGDTLLTIPQTQFILKDYLAKRSIDRDEKEIERTFTEAFQRFYYGKEKDESALCSPESDRMFWIELYTFVMQKLGIHEHWNEDKIHRCCHELYDIYTAPSLYELFDDVKDVLSELHRRGFKLGLISNFAPTLQDILEKQQIISYFDPVIVSTLVGLEKPNPAIFQLALDRSGLSADEVLYIGDHEVNDIWAPKQVGMDAVKMIRYDYLSGEGIRSLFELLE